MVSPFSSLALRAVAEVRRQECGMEGDAIPYIEVGAEVCGPALCTYCLSCFCFLSL